MMQVATEILNQLGGNKFRVMTGASLFVGGENSLQFKLPSAPHFVRNGINSVRVTLNGSDLYDVEFFKIRGVNVKKIDALSDVYAEDLRRIFTDRTGLDVSL